MNAIKKLLPLDQAMRLDQAGVNIPALFGYVYDLKNPTMMALIWSYQRKGFPDAEMGYCTAPDFAELWPALPAHLRIEAGDRYRLQMNGRSIRGYNAQYDRFSTAQVLLASNAETPVAAAGNLLLQLLDKGLITVDQVNKLAQLNAN